jgi:tetratricopeptide (TPR) repeat protein
VDLNPNDANAWAEMGRIGLGDEGLPRKALDGYGRAAALDPLNSYWQSQRCVAYADLARYQDAQRACTTARMLEPDSTLADSAETTLAAAQGLLDQALKWNAAQLALEPRDDFNAYWTRIHLFLSVGLAAPAREVVEAARGATRDEGGANAALVRVVFCQRGVEALRRHLELSRLDDSSNSVELFEAAYAHLVIGDPAGTKRLIARALQAADRPTGYADSPWHLRGARAAGTSYRVDLAAAEIALGDRASADRELNSVLAMVNAMIGAGVERNATYELRARIHALKGEADEAIRDLDHAARSGWRGAWWALNEPYFATLRSRTDFRSLIDRINQSNQEMIKKIQIGNRIT